MRSPEGDHAANGLAEVGVREIKAQIRILRSQLEQRLGSRIDEKDPLMSWIPRHAANCVSRYRLVDDGRTPDQLRCGKTWKRPAVEFGESMHFRPVGENNCNTRRRPKDAAWCLRGPSREMRCRNLLPARWCETENDNLLYRSSVATEERSAEAGETRCASGGSRSGCCRGVHGARCSWSRSEEIRHEARSREVRTSAKHAHSWQQTCTTRRFLTTVAEFALASSWRKTMIKDKVSECRHEQRLRLKMKSRVRKPERRWMLVNRRSVWMQHQSNLLPRIKRVDPSAQVQIVSRNV